jgi:hypothetical protein
VQVDKTGIRKAKVFKIEPTVAKGVKSGIRVDQVINFEKERTGQ